MTYLPSPNKATHHHHNRIIHLTPSRTIDMESPEIEELKTLVEQKYGRQLTTTSDFDNFAATLKKKYPTSVSSSTLKRLWGYVNDTHNTRKYTLDTLAQYLGHTNFDAFVAWLKKSTRYNSSFFNAIQVHSNELQIGQHIQIGWSPNRLLTLEYLGNSEFEIIKAENSKLLKGDRFVTGCFIKEQPLYLPYIERNGGRTSPFVAGRNGGISVIQLLDE